MICYSKISNEFKLFTIMQTEIIKFKLKKETIRNSRFLNILKVKFKQWKIPEMERADPGFYKRGRFIVVLVENRMYII